MPAEKNRSYKYRHFFAKPEEQALLLFWLNENIGNKPIDIASGIILASDHSDVIWIVCRGTNTYKTNILVANYSCTFVNLSFTNDDVFHVLLGSGNEECMLFVKKHVKAFEIDMSLIHKIISKSLYRQFIKRLGIVNTSVKKMKNGMFPRRLRSVCILNAPLS